MRSGLRGYGLYILICDNCEKNSSGYLANKLTCQIFIKLLLIRQVFIVILSHRVYSGNITGESITCSQTPVFIPLNHSL